MAEGDQSVHVDGDVSQVFLTQGDLNIETLVSQEKVKEFVSIVPEPLMPSPQVTDRLIALVREHNLILLGGVQEIDKSELALHLAWSLREMIQPETDSNGKGLAVWQWNPSTNPQNPALQIQKTDSTSIFVLTEVLPQHLNYDLARIQKAAARKHFVILSTDVPAEGWKLAERPLFWAELSQDIYHPRDLQTFLLQELCEAQNQERIPPALLDATFEYEQPLFGLRPISQVAAALKTPENIRRFVGLLCLEEEPPSENKLNDLIERAQDKKRIIWQWYHARLDSREQLLALGLSFFDGLFDDQFFAAVEELVEEAWQRRDASLRALDYCDLDNLQDYFKFIESEPYGVLIKSRLSGQRRIVFDVAWKSHRRQILAALPVIAQIVRNSVARRSLNSELYGTPERRDQLRKVIGESLSDIGLISLDSVHDTLLELSADSELGVQAVAARAMARWLEYGGEQQLFQILEDWQLEARILDLINAFLEGHDVDKSEGPRAYIRATVALTTSYAARYYPPNELPQKICELLEHLADDHNHLVRNRFTYHTLPMVVPFHLVQLRGMLHDMLKYIDLIPAVSVSLALTYEINPEEVLETLDTWCNEFRPAHPSPVNSSEITLREKVLASVVLTYGNIRYDQGSGPLTAREAFKRMHAILTDEKHPSVRRAAVTAISFMASRHFEEVEPQLQHMMAEVTESERTEIVKTLTSVYLEQREKLEGGDDIIHVGNREYQIWIDSGRPLTAIEQAMFRWIKEARNAAAQRIATRASIAFARILEQQEAVRIHQIREERERKGKEEKSTETPNVDKMIAKEQPRPGFYVGYVVPWLVTLREPSYRSAIQGLLPEALAQHESGRDTMDFVLGKWHHTTDDEIKSIADKLTRAIRLAENRGRILTAVLAFLILLSCLITCPLLIIYLS
jgi:hypothetical protein